MATFHMQTNRANLIRFPEPGPIDDDGRPLMAWCQSETGPLAQSLPPGGKWCPDCVKVYEELHGRWQDRSLVARHPPKSIRAEAVGDVVNDALRRGIRSEQMLVTKILGTFVEENPELVTRIHRSMEAMRAQPPWSERGKE